MIDMPLPPAAGGEDELDLSMEKGMDKEKGEAKPLSEFTDEEIMAEAEARKLVEPEDAAMEEDVADMEGDVVDDSLV